MADVTPAAGPVGVLMTSLREVAALVVSLSTAYLLATLVVLREGNPYDISNQFNAAWGGWSPNTNTLVGGGTIVLTATLYFCLRQVSRRWPVVFRVALAAWAAAIVFVQDSLRPIVNDTFEKFYVSFHAGEQLAASAQWLSGRELFTQIYVLHGAGEDVYKPALGRLLFGEAPGGGYIGGYLLITALLEALAIASFFAFLVVIIQRDSTFIVATLAFALTVYSGFTYAKNIQLIVVLLFVYFAIRATRWGRRSLLFLAAAGVIASLGVLLWADTGVLTVAIVIALAVAFAIFPRRDDGTFGWTRERAVGDRVGPALALVAGLVVGQLVTMAVTGPNAYPAFLRMTFVDIPAFQNLTWGTPLPGFTDLSPLTALIIVTALALIWAVSAAWPSLSAYGLRAITAEAVFALVLLLTTVVYLRLGLGRPDGGHIVMAAPFVLLFSIFVLDRFVPPRADTPRWIPLTIAAVLALTPGVVQLDRMFPNGRETVDQLRVLRMFPSTPDTRWTTETQEAVAEYVGEHAEPSDTIFVAQPDPTYYYVTGLQNPTRFAISWFMDPAPFTSEALADLKASPPALVLWDTGAEYANSDGVPILDRFPEIADWVLQNYPTRVTVDGVEIRLPAPP